MWKRFWISFYFIKFKLCKIVTHCILTKCVSPWHHITVGWALKTICFVSSVSHWSIYCSSVPYVCRNWILAFSFPIKIAIFLKTIYTFVKNAHLSHQVNKIEAKNPHIIMTLCQALWFSSLVPLHWCFVNIMAVTA